MHQLIRLDYVTLAIIVLLDLVVLLKWLVLKELTYLNTEGSQFTNVQSVQQGDIVKLDIRNLVYVQPVTIVQKAVVLRYLVYLAPILMPLVCPQPLNVLHVMEECTVMDSH